MNEVESHFEPVRREENANHTKQSALDFTDTADNSVFLVDNIENEEASNFSSPRISLCKQFNL